MKWQRITSAMLLLLPSLALAAQHEHRPWAGPGEAGIGYWIVAVAVVVLLLGFAAWAVYGRHGESRDSTGRYHALGALVLVMTLFTLVLYVSVAGRAERTPATDRAWDWQPGETLTDPGGSDLVGEPYRGYQVYLANGCTYCHTLYVRPEDIPTGWAPGATESDVTQIGDAVNYPFTLLGTQRNGPDLTIVGKRISDMSYHIDHLKDPRQFKPMSVMPAYAYLSDRDLRDLAAYMVSLGNPPAALREGRVTQVAAVAPADPLVTRGEELYRKQGCVACHTTDGSRSVGPSFQDNYGHRVTLADGTTVSADEDYLRESIRDPNAKVVQGYPAAMPPFAQLSESEMDALIAYIKAQSGEGQ